MKETQQNSLEGFLRISDILQIIPVSKTAWWAGVKSKRFPQPVKLGPRTTAWKTSEIRALVKELSNE